VHRASWPDERIVRAPLGDLRAPGIRRTATIIVGPALGADGFRDSHLYSKERARCSS
jgi:precorrin-4/cobalt-precorrin-4 C11-methyltransferase